MSLPTTQQPREPRAAALPGPGFSPSCCRVSRRAGAAPCLLPLLAVPAAILLSCNLCSCLQAQPVQQGARCKPATGAQCWLPPAGWGGGVQLSSVSESEQVENFSLTGFISDVPSLTVKSRTQPRFMFSVSCLNNGSGYLLASTDTWTALHLCTWKQSVPFFLLHK